MIVLDNVMCLGTESRLLDCPRNSQFIDCNHSEDAGVQCILPGMYYTYV